MLITEYAIERSKAEILADMSTGKIPTGIASFDQLVEYIDTLEKLGFWDSTYTNDACPSWTHDDLDLQIPYSEIQDTPSEYLRYAITKASLYGEQNAHILSTDDFAEVLAHIKNLGE